MRDTAAGLGTVAFWHLLQAEGPVGDPTQTSKKINPLAPKSPHFPAKVKNVIFLYMEGGPSQVDLFDPKAEMKKWEGQSLPPSMTKDLRLAFIKPTAKVWASPRSFRRYVARNVSQDAFYPPLVCRFTKRFQMRSAGGPVEVPVSR